MEIEKELKNVILQGTKSMISFFYHLTFLRVADYNEYVP